ncbi:MFS transporter [Caldimonas brevitalea]|uniref:Major facilitator superfamily n=1 Tax=Caldimonas brevitalea TaxID=413882 RepID=A0A0G3BIZ1_9BURK|nr:MFS transporter [Caldimonas brevitalea]AKJ29409.1 major facilitator superfamily [Caldimonas brevitalea]
MRNEAVLREAGEPPGGATEGHVPRAAPLMRPAFALLWLSETAFDLGSALMGFALGVWIFQQTGSAEQFSHAMLAAAVPAVLMAPVAGSLADRFDRRWVIGSCDVMSALSVVCLAWLLFSQRLVVEHLYVFNAVAAIINAVRTPAYRAAVSVIVPKDKMTQASGLIGMTQSLLQIGAPMAAGYVMGVSGLEGVIAVDIVMVAGGALAAFGGLSRARHAIRGVAVSEPVSFAHGTVLSLAAVLRYFRSAPTMLGLAGYGVLQQGLLVVATSMMTPLVLSTHSSDVLGLVLTCGAAGGLAGSVLLLLVRMNRRLMLWVLGGDFALSLFVLLAGFATSSFVWCVCAFCALMAGSASGACAGALWMRKTPKASRGSVFAWIAALDLLAMCAVLVLAGYLGERVFEPALAAEGRWADSLGVWVGTGKGRGLGFLFIVCGAGSALLSLVALAQPRLRRLDRRVPDALDVPSPAVSSSPPAAAG